MTIRNLERFIAALWDWGELNGCFGNSRARVGDVDGIVGHCGEVLLLEGKPMSWAPQIGERWQQNGDREPSRNGQARLWSELAGRGITVLVLYGEPGNTDEPMKKTPQRLQLWRRFKNEPDETKAASWEIVRRLVSRWWQWADEQGKDFS